MLHKHSLEAITTVNKEYADGEHRNGPEQLFLHTFNQVWKEKTNLSLGGLQSYVADSELSLMKGFF